MYLLLPIFNLKLLEVKHLSIDFHLTFQAMPQLKHILSISFFSLLSLFIDYQKTNETIQGNFSHCATDNIHQQAMATQPTYATRHHALEKAFYQFQLEKKKSGNHRAMADYTLPVVVHIIHNNGAENITDAEVIQGIQNLNNAFANVGYYDPTTGVDTRIQFCLAKRDPDQNATSGITRTVSPLTEYNRSNQELDHKNLSRWDPLNYINIWLAKEICSNNGCGVVGYARFPASHGNPDDGIAMEARYFAQNQGTSAVIAHEIGHYLGLYHTFQGGCGNNDCLIDGDRVCDTPPDQTTAWIPCGSSSNSCSTDVNPGDPNNPFTIDQDDLFWNYMDYSDLDCYSAFTAGQTDRMHFFITGERKSLLDSKACTDPCIPAITAAFTVNPGLNVAAGELVTFINTSINATNYNWYIDNVLFASTLNASYTFPSTGTYEIQLVTNNADPNCEAVFSVTINVTCPVEANFTPSVTLAQPGQTISFTNNSNNASAYSWTVNGAPFSSVFEPNYTLVGPGLFNFCLTANNGICEDTYCQSVLATANSNGCEDTFLKTIGQTNINERLYQVVNLPNGNIILGGVVNSMGALMEMTPTGIIVWQKAIPFTNSSSIIVGLILANDGTIVGVARNFLGGGTNIESMAFKYDYQSHTVLWSTILSKTSSGFYQVIENGSNNFVFTGQLFITGSNQACNGFIMELDGATGTVLQDREYDLGTCETFSAITTHNNGYYVTGRQNNSGGSTNRMRPGITRLDENLQEEWNRLYLVNATNLNARLYPNHILLENNQLIVTGSGDLNGTSATDIEAFIYETDLDGNINWARQLNFSIGNNERPYKLISLPDGFLLSGDFDNGSSKDVFLLKLDKQGNTLWAKYYDTGTDDYSYDLTFQAGYIFLVGGSLEAGSNNFDFLLGKLDLNGEVEGGCEYIFDLTLSNNPINNLYDGNHPLTERNNTFNLSNSSPISSDFTIEENILCQKICNEICDNGLDDDGDGYVDCYDTDCNCLVEGCNATALESNFTARLSWESNVDKVAINSTPIIGNLNPSEDDIPEIIVCESTSSASSNMADEVMIFNGDGSNNTAPRSLFIPGRFDGYPMVHPVIGDVNADGIPELLIVSGDRRLQVFTNYRATGSPVMESMVVSSDLTDDRNQKPLLADFDKDGISEVYIGNDIYQFDFSGGGIALDKILNGNNSYGQLLWNNYISRACNPVAADLLTPTDCGGDPDCDGLELVAGNIIYSVDLSTIDGDGPELKIQRDLNNMVSGSTFLDGYTSVADVDLDGTLDVLVSSRRGTTYGVYVWNKNNLLGFFPLPNQTDKSGGLITVANVFDDTSAGVSGDLPEILVTCGLHITCFNLSALFATPATPYWWDLPTTDGSGVTGITVFDFNGDGLKEIVYRDEDFLRIMYGGAVPFPVGVDNERNWSTFVAGSGTFEESPVVADVDNDGEAEIALTSYTFSGTNSPAADYRGRIRVFESDLSTGNPWMSARPVWNQASYFVVNVNDDLSIPAEQQQHHLEFPSAGSNVRPFNNFLTQVSILDTAYQPFLPIADAVPTLDSAYCNGDSILLSITICNEGDAPLNEDTPVAFYDANPTQNSANLIHLDSVCTTIPSDSCLTCDLVIPSYNGKVYLVVNDNNSLTPPYHLADDFPVTNILECDYENNLDSFEVEFTPIPPLNLGPDVEVCDNGIHLLDAGMGFKTYLWQDGSTEPTFTTFEPGIYWVEVTGDCNQILRDTVIVSLLDNTKVDLPEDLYICEGDSVILTSSGFMEYEWFPDTILDCRTCPSVIVSPLDSVTVTLVVRTSDNCYSSDSVKIRIQPKVEITDQITLCDGDTVLLHGNPVWEAGNYFFNGTSMIGCDSIHQTLVVLDQTYLNRDSISICQGDTIEIYGQQYWQAGIAERQETTYLGCDSIIQTQIFLDQLIETFDEIEICDRDTIVLFGNPVWENGIYSESYTIPNSCDSISYFNVTVNPLFINQSTTEVCAGDTLFALGQIITNPGLYEATISQSGSCDSLYQLNVSFLNPLSGNESFNICDGDTIEFWGTPVWEAGVYDSVFYSVFSGCDSTHSINLLVDPLPQVAEAIVTCVGETIEWQGQDLDAPGNYSALINGNDVDCDTVLNLDFTWLAPPSLEVEAGSSCQNDSSGYITIIPTGVSPPFSFQWNAPGLNGSELTNLPPGTYQVTLSDAIGCTAETSIEVAESPTPFVELPAIIELKLGETYQINPVVFSSGDLQFFWTPNIGLSCSDCLDPLVDIVDDSRYTLQVINEGGCVAIDSISFRIRKDRNVYIPNAISTNNDGINDYFTVFTDESVAQISTMKIFDRWGELILEKKNFQPNDPSLGWDGTFKGKPMNPGVFVYVIDLLFKDGVTIPYSGDLVIIR